jgi:hypothetical protein
VLTWSEVDHEKVICANKKYQKLREGNPAESAGSLPAVRRRPSVGGDRLTD